MKSRHKRFGAFLLATLYFCFAGGIEFLHDHADGVLPATTLACSAAIGFASSRAGLGKAPDSQKAPSTECAACHWDKYGYATTPSVTTPVIAPVIEVAFVTSSPELPQTRSPLLSSRGPPLA